MVITDEQCTLMCNKHTKAFKSDSKTVIPSRMLILSSLDWLKKPGKDRNPYTLL